MAFIDQQLDMSVDLNSRASIGFNTSVIETGQGLEDRQSYWTEDLGSWQTGQRRMTMAEKEYLLQFFRAAKGKFNTWRYKDWLEYMATGENIGTGDGVEVDFQLQRSAGTTTKTVYLPVSGTVKVYIDDVEQVSGWTVGLTTGIVTFSVAPLAAEVVTADFQFDKHARFDTDQFQAIFEAKKPDDTQAFYMVGSLPVVEVRGAP